MIKPEHKFSIQEDRKQNNDINPKKIKEIH